MIKRHVKKNQQNPNGAIVEREGTVHISNVMKVERVRCEHEAHEARNRPLPEEFEMPPAKSEGE